MATLTEALDDHDTLSVPEECFLQDCDVRHGECLRACHKKCRVSVISFSLHWQENKHTSQKIPCTLIHWHHHFLQNREEWLRLNREEWLRLKCTATFSMGSLITKACLATEQSFVPVRDTTGNTHYWHPCGSTYSKAIPSTNQMSCKIPTKSPMHVQLYGYVDNPTRALRLVT